jgi:hypothetical protein
MEHSPAPAPQRTQYRITLFYGPEPVTADPPQTQCVFNVKKRSWKAGVQIAVPLRDAELARARDAIGFEAWLESLLAAVPDSNRESYEARAGDLMTQFLCELKLQLALDAGLSQENQRLDAEAWSTELAGAAAAAAERIKSQILTELDLPGS